MTWFASFWLFCLAGLVFAVPASHAADPGEETAFKRRRLKLYKPS